MIPIKRGEQIEKMRHACQMAATVLEALSQHITPGISTYELDQLGKKYMDDLGVESACYHYKVGRKVYPAYTCISVNEEIVHGIGTPKKTLKEGDVITLDVCVKLDGYVGDNARTFPVGKVERVALDLLKTTEEALMKGINQARPGNRIGDISWAIQSYVESRGYSVVREFVGHGVGKSMHESPEIPNFGYPGSGLKLLPGMTLAIEPMVNMGGPEIVHCDDGWTAITKDHKLSAHFEHTMLITEDGPEILTLPKKRKKE